MSQKINIPNNIKEVFESIESEIIWLHGKWNIYRQLYGTDEERIILLNRSAQTFFRLVQDVLFNDVILSINRLTDPPRSSGRDNRTFAQLIFLIDTKDHSELVQNLKEKLDILMSQCDPFRIRRNKVIAHSDLMVALSIKSETTPDISRNSIENALKTVRDFMNEINLNFGGNYTAYEHVWLDNDGETMISLLQQFWTHRDEEMRIINEYIEQKEID
jgi:hypothetical protein